MLPSGAGESVRGAIAEPTLRVETDIPDEVRIYDRERGRRLVAAIELVSPANKDRRETRRAFVAKCAFLLQQQVSVIIVDVVTVREFNLYAELLAFLGERPIARDAADEHLRRCLSRHDPASTIAAGGLAPSSDDWSTPAYLPSVAN